MSPRTSSRAQQVIPLSPPGPQSLAALVSLLVMVMAWPSIWKTRAGMRVLCLSWFHRRARSRTCMVTFGAGTKQCWEISMLLSLCQRYQSARSCMSLANAILVDGIGGKAVAVIGPSVSSVTCVPQERFKRDARRTGHRKKNAKPKLRLGLLLNNGRPWWATNPQQVAAKCGSKR